MMSFGRALLPLNPREGEHRHLSLGSVVRISFVLLSISTSGRADPAKQVYAPPTGFWLTPSNHSGKLYGPVNPNADWSIAQWNIPQDLPPFQGLIAANEFASVRLSSAGYTLEQTTAAMPCDKDYPSGRHLTNEFDLFASPNNRNTPAYPQAPQFMGGQLSTFRGITHRLSVKPVVAKIFDSRCEPTQAALLTAIVLTDAVEHQTFFYQVRLGMLHGTAGEVTWQLAKPFWFFTGNNPQSGGARQFGFGDNITSFGLSPVSLGQERVFSFNPLSRLKELIVAGQQYGMDQDLSHWRVTGTYHGQNAFGHLDVASVWGVFSLTVEQ